MVDAALPDLRLDHHLLDHHEGNPDLRQGRLLHGPLPLRRHDHLLHSRPDPERRRSRLGPHVLAQVGQPLEANGLARCSNSGLFNRSPEHVDGCYKRPIVKDKSSKFISIKKAKTYALEKTEQAAPHNLKSE